MSVEQYLRQATLHVYGDGIDADLSDLRFAFSVHRGDIQTPNSADIRVYNVSKMTADAIRQTVPTPEFTRVVIQAGYAGNYGVIFDGEIKQVRRGRESQLDTYIDITAADGDSAYNYSFLATSLAAELTSPANQVETIVKDMAKHGVKKGYVPDLDTNALPRGKVFYGMSRDEMRKISFTTQTSWSIQEGSVQMVPLAAYMPGEIPVISAATGMVGLPEQTQNGIKVKVLLNPSIKIGQAIQIDNASIQQYRYNLALNQQAANFASSLSNKLDDDGLYYVMVAEHNGDTRGHDWYTDVICLAIDATIAPEYIPRFPLGEDYLTSVKRY